ncbi:poly(ADP-ribose) glycohydrolase-like [Brachionus plicatilis]|uniref:poly(ADP-ribose) glycohydrolase n=1 Tax=Brachionus plicatilis TaxID=10195 RepID=A0A3M7QZE6_BRAPC|nr:poly(ADP-ribose) glycohydrolase-like [Brachionus plicatilis]
MDWSSTSEINFEIINQAGFKCISEENDFFIDLTPSKDHTVLFDQASDTEQIFNYVELPWNSQKHWDNVKDNLKTLKNRLKIQKEYLLIELAISRYHRAKQNYKNIEKLFQGSSDEQSNYWLDKLIPKIADLVLESAEIIQKQIPILKSNSNHSISITKKQSACILANAFFCTFENRFGKLNPPSMPFFNLNQMFDMSSEHRNSAKIEKLKCIMAYFERVTDSEPAGVLTYSRFSLKNEDKSLFENSSKKIRKTVFMKKGKIEDCTGAIQVDFANKFIGGGVFNSGCVQEEIRFVICPELLVSLLFMERMSEHECILIRGAERFADYTGYSDSFRFKDKVVDKTKKDKHERILCDVLAIDAHRFWKRSDQFSEKYFWREIFKSYAGFSANYKPIDEKETVLPYIATGNWDLIQLISASVADRDLVYFTFGNEDLCNELEYINSLLVKKSMSVADVVKFNKNTKISLCIRDVH